MTLFRNVLSCFSACSNGNNLELNQAHNMSKNEQGKLFYTRGVFYLEKNDIYSAIHCFISSARNGYQLSYYLVAGCYKHHIDLKDYSKASQYYSKALINTFPAELHHLGRIYYLGDLQPDLGGSMKLYCRISKLMLSDSKNLLADELYLLGKYYLENTGIMKELVTAAIYLCKAAKLGHVVSEKIMMATVIPELESKTKKMYGLNSVESLKIIHDIKKNFKEGKLVIDKDGDEKTCIERLNSIVIDVVCDVKEHEKHMGQIATLNKTKPSDLINNADPDFTWSVKQLKTSFKEDNEVLDAYKIMKLSVSKTSETYNKKLLNNFLAARLRHPLPTSRNILEVQKKFNSVSEKYKKAGLPELIMAQSLKPVTYLYERIKDVLGDQIPSPLMNVILDYTALGSYPILEQKNIGRT